jgi:hypothetical protein
MNDKINISLVSEDSLKNTKEAFYLNRVNGWIDEAGVFYPLNNQDPAKAAMDIFDQKKLTEYKNRIAGLLHNGEKLKALLSPIKLKNFVLIMNKEVYMKNVNLQELQKIEDLIVEKLGRNGIIHIVDVTKQQEMEIDLKQLFEQGMYQIFNNTERKNND